jgi:N-acyl amino acid synthase of PEP-CTERM/exosortase system
MNLPSFTERFKVVFADTPERREICYHLRHVIYCEERGFEDPRPDHRECDEYDDQSTHVLLRDRASGEYVGTARLIRPCTHRPALPIETAYGPDVSSSVRGRLRAPRQRMAEISRLVIMPSALRARRPHAVGSTPDDLSGRYMSVYPPPSVGLCLALFAVALQSEVSHLLAIAEPRLMAYLGKLGMQPQAIGPTIDYRGLLVPFLIRPYDVIGGIRGPLEDAFQQIWFHLFQTECPFAGTRVLAAANA